MKFKIGDKVKIINTTSSFYNEIGEIYDINGTSYYIKIQLDNGDIYRNVYCEKEFSSLKEIQQVKNDNNFIDQSIILQCELIIKLLKNRIEQENNENDNS